MAQLAIIIFVAASVVCLPLKDPRTLDLFEIVATALGVGLLLSAGYIIAGLPQ